jgi:hypothetical protein
MVLINTCSDDCPADNMMALAPMDQQAPAYSPDQREPDATLSSQAATLQAEPVTLCGASSLAAKLDSYHSLGHIARVQPHPDDIGWSPPKTGGLLSASFSADLEVGWAALAVATSVGNNRQPGSNKVATGAAPAGTQVQGHTAHVAANLQAQVARRAAQAPGCPVLGSAQQQQAAAVTPCYSDHSPLEELHASGAHMPQAPLPRQLLEPSAANPPKQPQPESPLPPPQHRPRFTIRRSNAGELTAPAPSPGALCGGLPAAASAPCVWQLQACSHTLFGSTQPGPCAAAPGASPDADPAPGCACAACAAEPSGIRAPVYGLSSDAACVTSRPSSFAHIGEDLVQGMSGRPVVVAPHLQGNREQAGVSDLLADVHSPAESTPPVHRCTQHTEAGPAQGLCQPRSLPDMLLDYSSSPFLAQPYLSLPLPDQPLAPVLPLVLGSIPTPAGGITRSSLPSHSFCPTCALPPIARSVSQPGNIHGAAYCQACRTASMISGGPASAGNPVHDPTQGSLTAPPAAGTTGTYLALPAPTHAAPAPGLGATTTRASATHLSLILSSCAPTLHDWGTLGLNNQPSAPPRPLHALQRVATQPSWLVHQCSSQSLGGFYSPGDSPSFDPSLSRGAKDLGGSCADGSEGALARASTATASTTAPPHRTSQASSPSVSQLTDGARQYAAVQRVATAVLHEEYGLSRIVSPASQDLLHKTTG